MVQSAARRQKKSKAPWVLSAFVVVALVALVFFGFSLMRTNDVSNSSSATAAPSTSATTPPSTHNFVANNPRCGGFTTKLDPHIDGEVITGGIPQHLSEEGKRSFVAQKAKEDLSVLQPYFNDSPLVKLGIKPPITDPAALTPMKDGECWSKEAIELYNSWLPLWSVTDVKPVPLPASGTNTGGVHGGSSYQISGPIPAGTATQFTYRDAKGSSIGETKVRNECGNPVSDKPMLGLPSRPAPPIGTGYRPPPPPRSTPPPPPPPDECEGPDCCVDCPPPPPPPCPPDAPSPVPPCWPPDEEKDPSEGSGPNGNSGPGEGQNEDPGPGEFLPPTYAPETPRIDLPSPEPEPGQDGGTPTTVVAPPPGPDVVPTPGQEGSEDGAVAGPEEGEEEFVPGADW